MGSPVNTAVDRSDHAERLGARSPPSSPSLSVTPVADSDRQLGTM
jgi:hypothetical protein